MELGKNCPRKWCDSWQGTTIVGDAFSPGPFCSNCCATMDSVRVRCCSSSSILDEQSFREVSLTQSSRSRPETRLTESYNLSFQGTFASHPPNINNNFRVAPRFKGGLLQARTYARSPDVSVANNARGSPRHDFTSASLFFRNFVEKLENREKWKRQSARNCSDREETPSAGPVSRVL